MEPVVAAGDARKRRLAVMAQADAARLSELFAAAGLPADHAPVRGPETGLVTVRGRTGGGGAAFNLGEATVTRATVRLPDGSVGHSAMLGRDHAKARLAAVIDALACEPGREAAIESGIIAPLAAEQMATDERVREETAATRVEFFTMVRGED